MATLSEDEIARVKRECLDNLLDIGARPLIGVHAIWNVVRDNVSSSSTAATTSTTSVAASTSGPTPVALTLGSAAGLAVGVPIQVDVGPRREVSPVVSISGSAATVHLERAHTGTYPVEVESALTIVRGLLSDLTDLDLRVREARASGGIKKVDEVEFFGSGEGRSRLDELRAEQTRLRWELATAVGLRSILENALGAFSRLESY